MAMIGGQADFSSSGGLVRRSSGSYSHDQEEHELDFQNLKMAALQKLSEKERRQHVVLPSASGREVVPLKVSRATTAQRQQLVAGVLEETDQSNEAFTRRVRERMDRAGVELPKVEVRFKDLEIAADVYVGDRAHPTLLNTVRNVVDKLILCWRANKNKREFVILHQISSILKPGCFTLLLGPPGAGKTTLLKALAGKLGNQDLKITGDITYNGETFDKFIVPRTAAYIEQTDDHLGELTVRETLDFSARVQGAGMRASVLEELVKREAELGIVPDPEIDAFMHAASVEGKRHSVMTDYIMKIFGIDFVADTPVGNEMIRGISGGQKRRVTTAEMVVGPKKTLFMDEITTGLDASTAWSIVKAAQNFTHTQDATVLMALLQPPPEIYDLFDEILLLSEGHIVFHGPRLQVLPFFEELGFKCPVRKGVADFLQEVTSKKDQEQYWCRDKPYHYVSVPEMSAYFYEKSLGKQTLTELQQPIPSGKYRADSLVRTRFALNGIQMLKACLNRELILMKRNRFIYIFRTIQLTVLALVTSTLFFRTRLSPNTIEDGNQYLGVLFFSLLIFLFNGFSEIALGIQNLLLFYKQRDNYFYPAWVYSLPVTILRIPYSIVEALLWSCIVYWVVGLTPDAGRFFLFVALGFLLHQMAIGLFRFIGAVARTLVVANTLGSLGLLVVFVLGGFVLAKPDIPPWWIWGYWVSPLSYGQNALALNEFTSARWQSKIYDSATGETLGDAVLRQRGLFTNRVWEWIGFAALVGFYILFNILVIIALHFGKTPESSEVVVPEEMLKQRNISREEAKRSRRPSTSVRGGEIPAGDHHAIQLHDVGSKHVDEKHPTMKAVPEDGVDVEAGVLANGIIRRNSSTQSGGMNRRFAALRSGTSSQGKRYESTGRGMVLPFTPANYTFHNICYTVQVDGKDLRLLNNVSGVFRPKVLTALIGVSGAGKTTLMDVLAGRKTTGRVEGDMRINGYPKEQASFARISGYCEQTDTHSPATTVEEAVRFSARLRLEKSVDEDTMGTFIEEVMDLVELTSIRDAIVGIPGRSGLSVEQRKRLTIAVELVANPSIIFMDEPTSGLDARAAAIVMRTVRNTVDTGRTVVCTIHQPSIDIFESFDELLLLKRGGEVIYFGPLGHESSELVSFFQQIPTVPRIAEGQNPATWMLEVSTPAVEKSTGVDFAEYYRNSNLFKRNEAIIEELSQPQPGLEPVHFDNRYARPFPEQLMACIWKQRKTYWRSPQYNAVRIAMTILIGFIFGTTFWNKGNNRSNQRDVFNIAGGVYAVVLFLGVQNASTVQPVVAVERGVFYRERAAGYYSAIPYALGQVLVEIPYLLTQTAVYALITYAMIEFPWTAAKFWWYFLFMYLTLSYFTYYGMCSVVLTPNVQLAAVLSTFFYSFWNLFAGFIITREQMPGWWKWYSYINPVSWTLYGLVGSQLADDDHVIDVAGTGSETIKHFINNYFGFKYSFLGQTAGILIAFVITFAGVVVVGIKFLNYQRR
eukprot:jgi/Chlat1/4791/Chrsp31S04779